MKKLYPFSVKNSFSFNQSPRDFIVQEVPLYEFSGEGEHLIVHIRKKDLTTWEMLEILAKYLDINPKDIGYAGLKDKHAMTTQYISILDRNIKEKIEKFQHPKIKILDIKRHNNKIRVGHLKGNHFKIKLKKVLGVQKDKLDSTLKWIDNSGVPNYFGEQRFGIESRNFEDGKKIVEGKLKIRDRKLKKLLINAYQSYLFNSWLSKRVELSLLLKEFNEREVEEILKLPLDSLKNIKSQKHFFKILDGDVLMHYPYGRAFISENVEREADRFINRDISVTGLLSGKRVIKADGIAKIFEEPFLNIAVAKNGFRRYAWIFLEDIETAYNPQKAHYEVSFYLPKGAYATNVICFLKGI